MPPVSRSQHFSPWRHYQIMRTSIRTARPNQHIRTASLAIRGLREYCGQILLRSTRSLLYWDILGWCFDVMLRSTCGTMKEILIPQSDERCLALSFR
jgi:hypothetical protein